MALSLPTAITSKKDITKLRREIERMADALLQRRVAHDKSNVDRDIPSMSKKLRYTMQANELDLNEENLKKLDQALAKVYDTAPQVRMAFAGEPDQESLEKLISWFRKETHPHIFIQVGIQPMLAGGVILRTPKNRYDFSIRTALLSNVSKLPTAIRNINVKPGAAK